MDQNIKQNAISDQQLILQNRSHLEVSGVTDIDSFDDVTVNCSTIDGRLVIRGSNLRVHHLDMHKNVLTVDGQVDSLEFSHLHKGGLFGRLLR